MKKYSITCGGQTISYAVKRSARRSFGLKVEPDLSVTVAAPEKCGISEIENVVRLKAGWILKKIRYFSGIASANPPRLFIDGETHRFMGKDFILRVETGSGKRGAVFAEGELRLSFKKNPSPAQVQRELYVWYREQAKDIFEKILFQCLDLFKQYGIPKPELKIMRMKSRWGSCNTRKKIVILNTELARAPAECIEYVAVHELCHLKHNGHGRAFYSLLEEVMPDWKQRKIMLREYLR
jgi:hypothetical protein